MNKFFMVNYESVYFIIKFWCFLCVSVIWGCMCESFILKLSYGDV